MTTRPAAPASADELEAIRQRNALATDDWLPASMPLYARTAFEDRRALLLALDREREARADERARHNAELRAAVLAIPDHQVSGREWEWGCDYRVDKRFPNCDQDNPEHDHELISRDRVLALLEPDLPPDRGDPPS